MHGGANSITRYRIQRQNERSRKIRLSHIDSFHDGERVLNVVNRYHQEVVDNLRARDLVTGPILHKFVHNMLEKAEGRPTATRLSFQIREILAQVASGMHDLERRDGSFLLEEYESCPSENSSTSIAEPDEIIEPNSPQMLRPSSKALSDSQKNDPSSPTAPAKHVSDQPENSTRQLNSHNTPLRSSGAPRYIPKISSPSSMRQGLEQSETSKHPRRRRTDDHGTHGMGHNDKYVLPYCPVWLRLTIRPARL